MNTNNIIQDIRNIVNAKTPITDISELLFEHDCLYLISKISNTHLTSNIKTTLLLNRFRAKETYNICNPIFKTFEKFGVSYAVIKGEVLSKAAYGEISYRVSNDIDLLVEKNNLPVIKKIMNDNGFVQGKVVNDTIVPFSREEIIFQSSCSHQIAQYVKKTNNHLCPFVNVDINVSILWGESNKTIDTHNILLMSQYDTICGIDIRKLDTEIEFIALCLHHYKDMNSLFLLYIGKFKLSLFSDIYFYIKNQNIDINKLKNLAIGLDVLEYVYYCIYLTQKIFASPTLEYYLNELYTVKADILINRYGLSENEYKIWGLEFPERLFYEKIHFYLVSQLSNEDIFKIENNLKFMY